jgi:hypothetical protein
MESFSPAIQLTNLQLAVKDQLLGGCACRPEKVELFDLTWCTPWCFGNFDVQDF